MARRRRNPVIGEHPDIFKKDQWGTSSEMTGVVVNVADMSPSELRKAASEGTLSADDYQQLVDWEVLADGDPEVLEAEGLSRSLARAIAAGLHDELLELDEEARDRRVQPFIKLVRERAEWAVEYRTTGEGLEGYVDEFNRELADEISASTLRKAARQVSNSAGEVDDDTLDQVLQDPAMYSLALKEGIGLVDGAVSYYSVGDIEEQFEGCRYDEQLKEVLDAGWHGDVYFPGLSDEDVVYAAKELERKDPYVYIETHRNKLRAEDLADGFSVSVGKHSDASIVAMVNVDALDEALAEHLGQEAPTPGPTTDNVVHTFDGTNESVSGASGRGMYVAQLTVKELRKEGATLGHCIGTEQYGHPKMLRDGKTKVYSIRTEAGKPKFTIEQDARSGAILEVKGKANRLPGFEPGKNAMTKPDEVRLVTEFLLSLGQTPEQIRASRDIRGGVTAMEEAGVDPFSPPPKKKREPRANPEEFPISARVARMVEKDYSCPIGGVWGTG